MRAPAGSKRRNQAACMRWFRSFRKSLKPGRLARLAGHKQLTRHPFASCPCGTLLRALLQPGQDSSSRSPLPLPLQTLPPPQTRVSTSCEASAAEARDLGDMQEWVLCSLCCVLCYQLDTITRLRSSQCTSGAWVGLTVSRTPAGFGIGV